MMQMCRIPVLLAAAAAATITAGAFSQAPAPAAVRPNIVLIQADDLGYGDLSAYGQAQFRTPALDRLAGRAPLADPQACRRYADTARGRLVERLID